jgi:hypothetical protein
VKRRLAFATAIAALPLALAFDARAAGLIDVQFGTTGNFLAPTAPYRGAAVLGHAGDQWNLLATPTSGAGSQGASDVPLQDASGAATGVTLSYHTTGSGAHFSSPFTGGPYDALLTSYLFADTELGGASTGPGVLTFSGLAPNAHYHLILYSVADTPGRGTRFTSGDGLLSEVVRSAGQTSFVEAANYADWSITATRYGQLAVVMSRVEDTLKAGFPEANLNGLQLTAIAAVPEPASALLLLAGLLALRWLPASRQRTTRGTT